MVHRGATGKPCRAIRNDFTREWEKRTAEILPFPLQASARGLSPPRSRRARTATSTMATPPAARAPELIGEIISARELIDAASSPKPRPHFGTRLLPAR